MALNPNQFLSNEDMEEFASDYLGLDGIDYDMYYEAYHQLNVDDEYEEEEYKRKTTELTQTYWEY